MQVFLHALQPLFLSCDYPLAASLMFAGTGVQYFILFMAFYKKAYSKPNDKTAKLVVNNNYVVTEAKHAKAKAA